VIAVPTSRAQRTERFTAAGPSAGWHTFIVNDAHTPVQGFGHSPSPFPRPVLTGAPRAAPSMTFISSRGIPPGSRLRASSVAKATVSPAKSSLMGFSHNASLPVVVRGRGLGRHACSAEFQRTEEQVASCENSYPPRDFCRRTLAKTSTLGPRTAPCRLASGLQRATDSRISHSLSLRLPSLRRLTLPHTVTRGLIMQKASRHPA
jgi:hypothetical protein